MTGEPRVYTAEEANALLPELTESLHRIKEARQVILEGGERVRRSAAIDGGGAVSQEYWDALGSLRREIESMVERDIVLRDPETGLLDFPGRVDGQDAFLCWQLGEDRVEWWHGPESGFAGRRPL
jgi:hypothetical protein